MSRYIGPVCRLCRAEAEKLFLKGERCYTAKCSFERRESAPGQHGKRRGKPTEYRVQLREKQKVKRMYGILEKPFRASYEKAARRKGVTGTELLVALEQRLDNMVFRMGFGSSRAQSRQLVKHGHVSINAKRVDVPSYRVQVGDVIEVNDKSKQMLVIKSSLSLAQGRSIPEWLNVDRDGMKGTVTALPQRAQLTHPINEQLIVELYSK